MPPRTQTPSRAAAPDHGLVVFAKNKRRVSAFYQATLSLTLASSEPSHDRLQGPGFELVIHAITVIAHLFGRYSAGSTGLPCLRISKCSLTESASVLPISAIFWPRLTC